MPPRISTSVGKMKSVPLIVLTAFIGAFISLAVAALIHPLADWLERFSRRFWGTKPFDVHIEANPSNIWAGSPPWVGATVWLPIIPDDPPPSVCPDWHAWARQRAGFDGELSVLEVTIQARKDVSVLIKGVKVRQKEPKNPEQIGGYILRCPAGGASITPRRIEVDLDWGAGTATWLDQSGQPVQPEQLTLSSGEFEQFQIWVTTKEGQHEWWLELILLSEGRSRIFPVRGENNQPFIIVGRRALEERVWSNGQWEVSLGD